jgi:hypothetical protein
MYRCALAALGAAIVLAAAPASAQVARQFPQNALRGQIVVTAPPELALNGQPARLAPAARIRGQDNMIVLSAALVGQKLAVHYTLDGTGEVRDVWILRADELARQPWPVTPQQAAAWVFDPVAQVWSRP